MFLCKLHKNPKAVGPKAREALRLMDDKREKEQVVQLAPLKEPGKGRGSVGGIRAASRDLGIDPHTAP